MTQNAKRSLRKEIRKLKNNLTESDRITKSSAVMKKLEEHPCFIEAETVFIFWSMDDEVDTRNFILKWANRKKFILPAINGDELCLKEFTGINRLVSGDLYSIPEPENKPFTDFEKLELAIIPGVAFDKDKNRMGRGKGYYDKILHRIKDKIQLIGICYDFQVVDHVPTEDHDVRMDEVICG